MISSNKLMRFLCNLIPFTKQDAKILETTSLFQNASQSIEEFFAEEELKSGLYGFIGNQENNPKYE